MERRACSISVSVGVASNSLTSDVVTVTLSDGSQSVTKTAAGSAGAGTITIGGFDTGGLGDGNVTISAKSTDVAGNVSTVRSATVTKDSAAPAAPTATYTDNNNSADQISGSAEANASIAITETAPGSATFGTTAAAGGAYSSLVASVNGKSSAKITVTYVVTAADAAGNVSAATTLTFADAR